MRRRTLPAVLAVAVLLLGACAGTDDATDADETTATATVATDETTDDAADDEPAEVTWEAVSPGGDCQCADGSEYRYWVSEGDPTRVAFFLQGGGACFTAETCAFEGGGTTYKVTVTDADDPSDGSGLLDLTDGRNPLEGWSMVYVPYCTGDVHLGDATTEYSDELTVQHKGAVNATAALDDLTDRFPDAAEVLVAGESAGSIATPYYAGLAHDRLPDAEITVLADGSGAYPDVPAVNATIGALWGTLNAVPDWPTNADVTAENWSLPGLFVRAGAHAPDITFARHDYAYDATQEFFAALAGIADGTVLSQMDANEVLIEDTGVDLLSFTSPGDDHTILSQSSVWEHEAEGVRLIDWITDLVEGDPVADVHCTECEAG
mgnify:FL=1